MVARYVIRFDDLCPTMNWDVWDRIEPGLVELGIRPILAVVPDNEDPVLQVGPPNEGFWERVRAWDRRGWTVAYHGYHHTYVTDRAGIVGLNHRSEFAGLPYDVQERKIRTSVEIMRSEGLAPAVWTAPSHSFDRGTVSALRANGIRIINEGFYPFPHVEDDMTFVPHQMWRFRTMPAGQWTFGYHVNAWGEPEVRAMLEEFARHRDDITDLGSVVRRYRGRRMRAVEPLAAKAYVQAIRARVGLRSVLGGTGG